MITTNNNHNSKNSRQTRCRILLAIIFAVLIPLNFGCSSGSSADNPLMPSTDGITDARDASTSGEPTVLGLLDVTFDPESLELEAVSSRSIESYVNVTPFVWNDYVTLTQTSYDSFTQVVEFEVEITNPTAYDAYDVRVLFLQGDPDAPWLKNANDYTKHYNAYSCHEINPFRSYAKFEPGRIFASGATHSETFEVQIQGPPYCYGLLIAAHLPGNTDEAYEIVDQWVTNDVSASQTAEVYATVRDHQGDLDQVYLDTTILTGGTTQMVNFSGDQWMSAPIQNLMGLAPGSYWFRIVADSANTDWDLIDMIEIEVLQDPWISDTYPITTNSDSLDIGVIEGLGGSHDSQIVMAEASACGPDSAIAAYYPYYSGSYSYVGSLANLDPANPSYKPFPVSRIDAAGSGAFSFTNLNEDVYTNFFGTDYYNYQVWSVFDAGLNIYTDPSPDSSRYMNLLNPAHQLQSFPIDVCDDFRNGQYALFDTLNQTTSKDLLLIGTTPDDYTHSEVKYVGNLDAYTGNGNGLVDPDSVKAIDTYVVSREGQFAAILYILEERGGHIEVEVFSISDTAPGFLPDTVNYEQTITIQCDLELNSIDMELLPPNEEYDLNPSQFFPTLCILASQPDTNGEIGRIFLMNAYSGAYLEELSAYFGPDPLFENCEIAHLDNDDGDWQIHVTYRDPQGDPYATVFTYVP